MRGYVERHSLLEYKCQKCGCDGFWQGEPLHLQIHHKDGDNTNNTLENLGYLCPNCHSQTESYCRRKDSFNENE
jgi:Zn finger protein HypA/HybF involved in hydrogenase expression